MTTTTARDDTNPLFNLAVFPPFDDIRPEHVVPAMRQLLADLESDLKQLEDQLQPTWAGLVEPFERIEDRLSRTWGVVGHLMGVQNSDALRQAQQAAQADVVQFLMRLGQSQAIYQGLKALQASPAWASLDA